MKRIILFVPIFIVIFFSCKPDPVPTPPAQWVYYNMLSLPSNYITSIAFGGNNNKWIGTDSGLVKFDGKAFSTPVDVSITGYYIKCLATDATDIWIGTNEKGLIQLNESNLSVVFVHDTSNDLESNHVNCIAIDSGKNKWIGTKNGCSVIGKSPPMLPLMLEVDFLPVDLISIDGGNNIWAGYNDPQLSRLIFNGTQWENVFYYDSIPDLTEFNTKCIATDPQGNVWIGGKEEDGYPGYLIKYSIPGWKCFLNSQIAQQGINCLAIDEKGTIWFTSPQALPRAKISKFNGITGTITDYSSPDISANVSITCITIDNKGNIWIGCDQGLFVFNENGIKQ